MTKIPNLSPAAGWLKDPESLAKLISLELEEVTVGSFALKQRAGNSGDVFYWSGNDQGLAETSGYYPGIFINSMGIPCRDFGWFCDNFKLFVEAAGRSTLRVSISPFNQGDLEHMVRRLCVLAQQFDVEIIIEVNLGCPNVWGDAGQKALISHDIGLIQVALQEVAKGRGRNQIRIAVKFSPIFDPFHIGLVVDACTKYGVYEIVTINTVPNAALFNTRTGTTVINARPEHSDVAIQLGGQSGISTLPIAVGNVLMFKQAIKARKASILLKGIGGICDGWSLRQHILAGADSFAVGGHAIQHGGGVFPEIIDSYLTHFG